MYRCTKAINDRVNVCLFVCFCFLFFVWFVFVFKVKAIKCVMNLNDKTIYVTKKHTTHKSASKGCKRLDRD